MARQIISISAKAAAGPAAGVKADILVAGMFSDAKTADRFCGWLDKRLGGAISNVIRTGSFEGKEKTTAVIYTGGKIAVKNLMLVGLGKKDKASLNTLRKAAAVAADKAVQLKAQTVCVGLGQQFGEITGPAGRQNGGIRNITAGAAGQAITEGLYFGAYRYDEYIAQDKEDKRPKRIAFTIAGWDGRRDGRRGGAGREGTAFNRGITRGNVTGAMRNYARTLSNRPANVINPAVIAAEAKKLARRTAGLGCTVIDSRGLGKKKMGGILAVGGGSANKPCLIVLKYKSPKSKAKTGTRTGAKDRPAIGLVGKAITFDSGGISLKGWEGMDEMKFDKSGGVAVLAAMGAIAQLKPDIDVYGIIPAAENMPSGTSYRPGDIVTTYSGKTVEILSTDAEGRMILCDAIAYAGELGCERIVDIATLTGACAIALGQQRAGLMGNDEGLIEAIEQASKNTGERVWRLPCDDEYIELVKSKVADLKNIGGKFAGACTAAAFLGHFAGRAKWAHIDIAGVRLYAEGPNGDGNSVAYGVRLLTEFVINAAG